MGKKTKSPVAKKASELSPEVEQQFQDVNKEAAQLFISKEYAKAVELYDKALKLVADSTVDKANVLSAKAACFYQQKRYKEAVKECTCALDVQPNSVKALSYRAKAYEQQGLYKQALSDVQAINKTESATIETRDSEKRLKDIMAGRNRPASAANGAASRPAQRASPKNSMPYYFTAKCTLGSETRLVHMSHNVTYADLYTSVKAKFPSAGPFVLKYVDKEGDLVTITQKQDIHNALTELLAFYEKQLSGPHGPKLLAQAALPPLKVTVQPVASEADVPKVPEEEELERQALVAAQQRAAQAKATARKEEQGGNDVYEIDEWLIDFANLFRDMTGIDPDRHVDFHNLGWEACTKAMDSALASEKALPLFTRATDRFKEVTCTGLLNWGNVHICIAHKLLDEAANAGKSMSDVAAELKTNFDEAEKRFNEAMAFKPDFYDGACALGQLEFERAKAHAGLLVKPVRTQTPDESVDPKEAAKQSAAAAEAAAAALREALTKCTGAAVESAKAHIDKAGTWFAKALENAELEQKGIAAEKGDKEKEEKVGEPAPQEVNLVAQAQIMHGNILYEWSQILAAVSQDWRPVLDRGVALFKSAGCSEADIRAALKNHSRKDDLDLGPDPVPEPAAAPAEADKKAEDKKAEPEKKEAKGLPSLSAPKKKKNAE